MILHHAAQADFSAAVAAGPSQMDCLLAAKYALSAFIVVTRENISHARPLRSYFPDVKLAGSRHRFGIDESS